MEKFGEWGKELQSRFHGPFHFLAPSVSSESKTIGSRMGDLCTIKNITIVYTILICIAQTFEKKNKKISKHKNENL